MSNRGRPLKFETVRQLQNKINAYFKHCDEHMTKAVTKTGMVIDVPDPIPYTISGLAVFLETSRETLMNYQEREEFFDTIKAAKDKCLADAELRLYKDFTPGVVFSMKNNYGWVDKQEVEQSGGTDSSLTINFKIPRPKKDDAE